MLIGLLCILAMVYLGAPLVILFTMTTSPAPRFDEMTAYNTPPAAQQYINSMFYAIADLGFDGVGGYVMGAHFKNVVSYLTMSSNAARQVTAVVHVCCTLVSDEWKLQSSSVEFSTRYADKTVIDTNNVAIPSVQRRVSSHKVFKFPEENDVARLFRMHCAIEDRFGPQLPKCLPEKGGELAALKDDLRESCDVQTRLGMMRWDARGEVYRPTVFGAFYMTWRLLFPLKQILAQMEKSRARALGKTLLAG